MVYYQHADNGCYFGINTPKTKKGERTIPMMDSVKEALHLEKEYQDYTGIHCKVAVQGYTDATSDFKKSEMATFEDFMNKKNKENKEGK